VRGRRAAFDGHGSRRHDGLLADVGAGVLAWLAGGARNALPGDPFVCNGPPPGATEESNQTDS